MIAEWGMLLVAGAFSVSILIFMGCLFWQERRHDDI